MKVEITNIYTNEHKLFQGTPAQVEQDLVVAYPDIASEAEPDDLDDLLEAIESHQIYSVDVLEPAAPEVEPEAVQGTPSSDPDDPDPWPREADQQGGHLVKPEWYEPEMGTKK